MTYKKLTKAETARRIPYELLYKAEIGDAIDIFPENDFRTPATVHGIDGDKLILMTDFCCIDPIRICPVGGKHYPFENTELYAWLNEVFRCTLNDNIRRQVEEITLPRVSDIFGEPLGTGPNFILMEDVRWRIGVYNNTLRTYWLRSSHCVDKEGYLDSSYEAWYPRCVRPVIILKI